MKATNYLSKALTAISICTVIALMLFSSCTERLDITTKDAPPRLAIYGHITTDTMQHAIRINRSSGYFATEKPEGISNAKVTISTDDATFTLKESPDEAGLYLTDEGVYGLEGKTYTLNVSTVFDKEGQVEEYEASAFLPYRPRVDSIKVRDSKMLTDHVEVLFYGAIPDDNPGINYMSFHVYREHTLLNDSLINYSVIDDEYIDLKEIKGAPCHYLDQEEDRYKLTAGDSITLRVDILTKEYGKFIENTQSEVQGSIPIFSGPPANVPSNIKSKSLSNKTPIVGFFSAYGGRWASAFYKPD